MGTKPTMRKRTLRFAVAAAFSAAVACGILGGTAHTPGSASTAVRADSGWGATPFGTAATQYVAGDSGWGSTPFGTAATQYVAGDSGWGSTPAHQSDVPAGTTLA
jgi:hypothetical protein